MQYVNHFLKHLKNLNYSPKTIKDYSYILSGFEKQLNKIQIFDEKNVTESHFKDYIAEYKDSNRHSFYYKSVIIIKKYFRFLAEFNYIFISPIEKIKNPKQVVKHHPIIDKKELFHTLNSLNDESHFEIRTRAMLELLYSSALRPDEALNLNISNIDYCNNVILIRKTKTKTDRIVPVTNQALFWINKYIDKVRIRNSSIKDNNNLFISFHTSKQLTVKGLNNSLKYFFTKRNLKHFSLYSIRATSATHLFENGMSISHLQLLLGHSDLRATCIYVRVSFLMLKKLLKKYHPRNKLEDKGDVLMKFQKQVNLFIEHLERNEYSKRTIESYINNLKKFLIFIDKYYSRIDNISQITKNTIIDYYDFLKEALNEKGKALSVKTICHRLIVLKSFFKYLFYEDYVINNPTANIRLPRTEYNLNNKVLSEDDIFKIIDSIKPITPENIRDRAIVELFYSTGVRTSELAEIKIYDIDLKQQVLTVVKGKGGKTRLVPIGQHACYYLDLYLSKSRKYFLGNDNSEYLFLNSRSTPFNRKTLNTLMEKLTKNLNLKIKVTCYCYRHSIATHLIQNKVDVRYVGELLGHESPKTTMRYCHLTITDLKKMHALFHPRESLKNSIQFNP